MYIFKIPAMYRGHQVHKTVCAKTYADAAKMLECTVYNVRVYAYRNKTEAPFDGVLAYVDGGEIWREFPHTRHPIPFEKLVEIIDGYNTKKYAKFNREVLKKDN